MVIHKKGTNFFVRNVIGNNIFVKLQIFQVNE